jgi:major membrane immunogen (membrane-anchored lipoprotein)
VKIAAFARQCRVPISYATFSGQPFSPGAKSKPHKKDGLQNGPSIICSAASHFMKIAIITGVMAASILLAGCGKKNGSSGSSVTQPALAVQEISQPPSDAELRQKVTGVWKYSDTNELFGWTTESTFTFAPNGNYAEQAVITSKKERDNITFLGTWQTKDGVLITTITKADPIPQDVFGNNFRKGLAKGGFVNQHKIISVNNHEMVVEINVITIGRYGKQKGTEKWTR